MTPKKNNETPTFSIRLDRDLREKLAKIAEKEDRSLGWLINKAVEEYVQNHAKHDGGTR